MFFSWYAALIVINLFNILLNLIYHFFMKDLVGPRGIKGEIGERGPPGKDNKCGCNTDGGASASAPGFEIAESDGIISKSVFSSDGEGPFNVVTSAAPANTITGSVIYKE